MCVKSIRGLIGFGLLDAALVVRRCFNRIDIKYRNWRFERTAAVSNDQADICSENVQSCKTSIYA